jgi:hypothetical protein
MEQIELDADSIVPVDPQYVQEPTLQTVGVTYLPTKLPPKMTYAEFVTSFRGDPASYWRTYEKSCGCDRGDVRFEGGIVECGACSAKLKLRQ